jgi:large subunit ribosomal protein L15
MAEKQLLKLGALKPAPGSRPKRQRIGRGHGSGMVKTGGEGGQTPWARRLPHRRGYSQKARDRGHFGTHFTIVNLHQLEQWDPAIEITPESLREQGLVKLVRDGVKILGKDSGKALPSGLRLRDVLFSKKARETLAAAGAQIQDLSSDV